MLTAGLCLLLAGCLLVAEHDVQVGRVLLQPLPDEFALRLYSISNNEAKSIDFDFVGKQSGTGYELRQPSKAPDKALEGRLTFSVAEDGWSLYQLGDSSGGIIGLAKISGNVMALHATAPLGADALVDLQRKTGRLQNVRLIKSNWVFPDRESVDQLISLVASGQAPANLSEAVGYFARPGEALPDRLVRDGAGWRPARSEDKVIGASPPTPPPEKRVAVGRPWQTIEKRDRFDDRLIVQFWIEASEVSGSRAARLYLVCGDNSIRPRDPDVRIDFNTPLHVEPFGNRNLLSVVRMRFDDSKAGNYAWTVTDSRDQLMAFPFNERPAAMLHLALSLDRVDAKWTVHQFMNTLRNHRRLLVRAMSVNGRPMDAVFEIGDPEPAIARVNQLCPPSR